MKADKNELIYHLPISMIHTVLPIDESSSYDERCKKITDSLTEIKSMGFGGVLINYIWSSKYYGQRAVKETDDKYYSKGYEYLHGEDGWNLFNFACEECVRLGLRFWLYDENGYPSGTAGGQIATRNPDFGSRAMVIVSRELEPHSECMIELPVGHECFLSAAVYKSTGGYKEIIDFSPVYRAECYESTEPVHLVNTSDERAVACAFVKKLMFEGSHSQNNLCGERRYIDLGNDDAVKAFIDSTYEKYYARSRKYFNESIDSPKLCEFEAIFTDEPSYMGCYMNKGAEACNICSDVNDNIIKYPVVNFSNKFVDVFEEINGYSCLDGMIYCFAGDTDEGKKYRLDYYRTLSYMAEHAYFKQIGDWCEEHSLNLAGHVLMEDELLYHPTFEGNYFSLFRHMRYPGLDMLYGRAKIIYEKYPMAPKLISSVAKAYNKKHVMEEICPYYEHRVNIKTDEKDYYSLLALQYAMGTDLITSYYANNNPEYTPLNLAYGRIGQKTEGAKLSDVLLYYAIETVQMHHKGSDSYMGAMDVHGEYNAQEIACSTSTTRLQKALADAQVCYDFADLEFLGKCRVENGVLITPNNDEYRALVMPCMECVPELEALLGKFKDGGLELKCVSNEAFDDIKYANIYNSEEELAASFDRSHFCAPMSARNGNGVFMSARETERGRAFIFVNVDRECKDIEATVSGIEAPVLYNPLHDQYSDIAFESVSGAKTVAFSIDSLDTVIIMEK